MIKILALIFLFFILTPGILWSYKKKTNKYLIALLHAFLFVLIWHLARHLARHFAPNYVIQEGMENDEDEEDKPKEAPKEAPKEEPPPPNILKFVLAPDLKTDSKVIERRNTMEGPPIIVGANLIFGPDKNKSYLLFTNQKSKTSRLDNLIQYDIIDPKLKRITDFLELHKKYPDML